MAYDIMTLGIWLDISFKPMSLIFVNYSLKCIFIHHGIHVGWKEHAMVWIFVACLHLVMWLNTCHWSMGLAHALSTCDPSTMAIHFISSEGYGSSTKTLALYPCYFIHSTSFSLLLFQRVLSLGLRGSLDPWSNYGGHLALLTLATLLLKFSLAYKFLTHQNQLSSTIYINGYNVHFRKQELFMLIYVGNSSNFTTCS